MEGPVSGMYYLRATYYGPESGRFLTQETVPFTNLDAYVGSNPVNLVDPNGLYCRGWHPHHCVGDAIECGGN